MIAPIVAGSIVALYLVVYFIICIAINMSLYIKILIGVVLLSLAGVCIYVTIERINEIRKGEEDDLSKY